jgi:putative transposase
MLKRVHTGISEPDVCREISISSATFYKRRAKFGSTNTLMTLRMRGLKAENARFKNIYIEERLIVGVSNEVISQT